MTSQKVLRVVLGLFFFTLFAQSSFAQRAIGQVGAGRLVVFKLSTNALKGNLLGDSTEQTVAVYLPASYDTLPAKRFPTLYLLHGFTGRIEEWTKNGYQGMSMQLVMDELINAGKIREMIVQWPEY